MTPEICSRLFSFYAHINELPKVLIKSGDRHLLSNGGGGDQTVDKMSFCPLIAIQRVKVDCDFSDLDARTGDKTPECRSDVGS